MKRVMAHLLRALQSTPPTTSIGWHCAYKQKHRINRGRAMDEDTVKSKRRQPYVPYMAHCQRGSGALALAFALTLALALTLPFALLRVSMHSLP